MPLSRRSITAALVAAFCFVVLPAMAQDRPFTPSQNPTSNQGYSAAAITVGVSFHVTRAIYNGNASACNFTATMNDGTSVQFQNNQPGEYNPIQATQVSNTTCAAGTLLAIF